MEKMEPCPFCGGIATVGVTDDEGNHREDSYRFDPWSGLAFRLVHAKDDNPGCPIAHATGEQLGFVLYDDEDDAVRAWNARH